MFQPRSALGVCGCRKYCLESRNPVTGETYSNYMHQVALASSRRPPSVSRPNRPSSTASPISSTSFSKARLVPHETPSSSLSTIPSIPILPLSLIRLLAISPSPSDNGTLISHQILVVRRLVQETSGPRTLRLLCLLTSSRIQKATLMNKVRRRGRTEEPTLRPWLEAREQIPHLIMPDHIFSYI